MGKNRRKKTIKIALDFYHELVNIFYLELISQLNKKNPYV